MSVQKKTKMEACRVLIHFGPFWASIRDLKQMGLLIRTCKTLRAECDVVFAVRAMGKDKNIKKIWATLWLGIANGWMRTIENFTLSMALEIVADANPELARKAIITAFLFKNHKRWTDEDHSLEALQKDEGDDDNDNEDEDQMESGHNIDHLFDTRGDGNV